MFFSWARFTAPLSSGVLVSPEQRQTASSCPRFPSSVCHCPSWLTRSYLLRAIHALHLRETSLNCASLCVWACGLSGRATGRGEGKNGSTDARITGGDPLKGEQRAPWFHQKHIVQFPFLDPPSPPLRGGVKWATMIFKLGMDNNVRAIMPSAQQGFVLGRPIDAYLHEVHGIQRQGRTGCWIAMYFRKAFDTVPHHMLEAFLSNAGLPKLWVAVILSFLRGSIGFLMGRRVSSEWIQGG